MGRSPLEGKERSREESELASVGHLPVVRLANTHELSTSKTSTPHTPAQSRESQHAASVFARIERGGHKEGLLRGTIPGGLTAMIS